MALVGIIMHCTAPFLAEFRICNMMGTSMRTTCSSLCLCYLGRDVLATLLNLAGDGLCDVRPDL